MGVLQDALSPANLAGEIACLVVAIIVWRAYLGPLSNVPGPFWASISRLWHMYHITQGGNNRLMLQLHDEHGHFVRIAPNEVSVTHPDALRKLLLTPLHKSSYYQMLRFPDWRFRTPMSVTDPKEKNELSRQLASAYTMTSVIQSEGVITNTIDLLVDWLDKYAESGKPMALDRYLTYLTFDIVGEVVVSKPFGYLKKGSDIDGSINEALGFAGYVAIAPYFRWLHNTLMGNPFITWLDVLPKNYLVRTSAKALGHRFANDLDARFDYVAHWLRTHSQNPDKLSRRDVEAAATANIGAGADTTSCALQSFTYHMLRHPTAWETARAEIDAADTSSPSGVIPYSEAKDLTYLQACIKEALRVFPPVPYPLPRVVPKGGVSFTEKNDGQEQEVKFTEGTILSVNPYCIHLSREIWGEDAREFKPERWLDGDKEAAKERGKYFMAFGQGYNACVGQNVARIELSKIAATLVRDYDLNFVDPEREWKYRAYFTVVPEDWPVFVERRKREGKA